MMNNNIMEDEAMRIYWEVWQETQKERAQQARDKEYITFDGSVMTYKEYREMKENNDYRRDWH